MCVPWQVNAIPGGVPSALSDFVLPQGRPGAPTAVTVQAVSQPGQCGDYVVSWQVTVSPRACLLEVCSAISA
jgi:hypothetical protein